MFNEQNTVEDYVKDLLAKQGWTFVSKEKLSRKETDVLAEKEVLDALIRLNPTIQEYEDRAEEVLYKLRMIISSARGTGLVKTNEEFSKWIRNEKTMPFGENGEHVSINLIDYDNLENNKFIVTTQYTYISGQNRRADLVLLVNGLPLVIGECKTPVINPETPAIENVTIIKEVVKTAGIYPSLRLNVLMSKSERTAKKIIEITKGSIIVLPHKI